MNPKNSQDLFNKIRSQFSNIRLGDENGAATADPGSAVFFEFEMHAHVLLVWGPEEPEAKPFFP